MKKQAVLVRCPQCNCSVRSDRLEKHLKKVHRCSEKFIAESAYRQSQVLSDSRNFKEICVLIEEFLRERDIILERLEYVEDFSLMAFEILLGYTMNEVITIGGIQNRNTYISNSNRLQHIFLPLIEPLDKLLEPYKKDQSHSSSLLLPKSNGKRKESYISKSIDYSFVENGDSVATNWYDCNSVDPADASKYIGFYQREYGGSRFGSFPIHDDYGEESWADANPWE